MITGMPLNLSSDVLSRYFAPQIIFTEQEMQAADHKISQLLSKHAIVPCTHSLSDLNSFMNNVLLVPKKDSTEFWMILNLKNSPVKG